jgi:hypothetical protein
MERFHPGTHKQRRAVPTTEDDGQQRGAAPDPRALGLFRGAVGMSSRATAFLPGTLAFLAEWGLTHDCVLCEDIKNLASIPATEIRPIAITRLNTLLHHHHALSSSFESILPCCPFVLVVIGSAAAAAPVDSPRQAALPTTRHRQLMFQLQQRAGSYDNKNQVLFTGQGHYALARNKKYSNNSNQYTSSSCSFFLPIHSALLALCPGRCWIGGQSTGVLASISRTADDTTANCSGSSGKPKPSRPILLKKIG